MDYPYVVSFELSECVGLDYGNLFDASRTVAVYAICYSHHSGGGVAGNTHNETGQCREPHQTQADDSSAQADFLTSDEIFPCIIRDAAAF